MNNATTNKVAKDKIKKLATDSLLGFMLCVFMLLMMQM